MTLETYTTLLVLSGVSGLACWFIGLTDHMYRLGMPRNRRSARYDWIDNTFITIGSLFVVAFVGGLYYLSQ